jgi:5'-methylthioinosine phosphorylase
MGLTAIIGGSGFDALDGLDASYEVVQHTPFGEPSSPALIGKLGSRECLFLPRHGKEHHLPPHKVNYRANLWLLKQLNATQVISINVVGGITDNMSPDTLVVPHQIIDYTSDREHTFYDGRSYPNTGDDFKTLSHIDFSSPYSANLRQKILDFFSENALDVVPRGVYACTQGPRLETVAEIARLKKDGCDIVGMTAMPEAALAKEINIDYAAISVVVNWAAGVKGDVLSMVDIMNIVEKNAKEIKSFLPRLIDYI